MEQLHESLRISAYDLAVFPRQRPQHRSGDSDLFAAASVTQYRPPPSAAGDCLTSDRGPVLEPPPLTPPAVTGRL